MWELATRKLAWGITTTHREPIETLAFSPDGAVLAVRESNAISLWETASGHQLKSWIEPRQTDWGHGLAFSPDGQWLAYSRQDETVVLWDTVRHTISATLPGTTIATPSSFFPSAPSFRSSRSFALRAISSGP